MNELKAYKQSEEDRKIEIEQEQLDIELNWWKKASIIFLIFIISVVILVISCFFFIESLSSKPLLDFFGPLSSPKFFIGILVIGAVYTIIVVSLFTYTTYFIYVFLRRIKTSNLNSNFIENSPFYAFLLSLALHAIIWVPVWQQLDELKGAISHIIAAYGGLTPLVITLLLNILLSYKNSKIGKILVITILIIWLLGIAIIDNISKFTLT